MARPRSPRLAVLLGAALLTAGCAQTQMASLQPTTPVATSAAATSAAPAAASSTLPAPLTGLPVPAAIAKRPAVAVPLPLAGSTGLDRADLVVEEYESPNAQRVVAVFQSRDAAQLGPVGEIRPLDPALLPILRPLYGNSGGGTGIAELLAKAKIANLSTAARPDSYTPGEAGPVTSTEALRTPPTAGALPPPPPFPRAAPGEPLATTGLRSGRSLTVTAPGETAETWTWSPVSRRWSRPGVPGAEFTNIIVQTVEYKDVTLKDPARTVRSARVVGRGSCWAFSSDSYAAGTWFKGTATRQTGYVDSAAVPLRFATGSVWVMLVPAGTSVVAA